ncbi:hypothetical protein PH586_13120 [Pseudomonas sp. SA3-5]|uniref:IS21 family transposase n=1 Tax=Pseudomonas aestuarii TaxID=3018340 RepID=A0ABT4XGH9_9PSED|nr:hypothetical protein [Pseudomonas aestuarii]MDA7087326.1 hypothetical protein [Pseudomonas aestuarii]
MINLEMMGKFQRMSFRDKLSVHEITKRTGLARNTIRKWVRAPEAQSSASSGKLSGWNPVILPKSGSLFQRFPKSVPLSAGVI